MTKLIKSIILFAIFSVPLFYLPFTREQFQFNKEILFLVLMLLAGLLWFSKAVYQKKLEIIRTPLDVPILLIVLVYWLSTLFSADFLNSLVHLRGGGLPSFVTILSLALFYFIFVNVFAGEKPADKNAPKALNRTISTLFFTLMASSLAAQVIFYLSSFNIYFLPGQSKSFNTFGSFSSLMVFAGLTVPIALYFLVQRSKQNSHIFANFSSVFAIIYLLITFLTFNTINFSSGWIVVTLGLFVFFVLFTAYHTHVNFRLNFALITAGVLALSLISVMIKPPSILNSLAPNNYKPEIPAEITLSRGVSREIAIASSISNPITFVLGRGPSNFRQAFSKERSERFNNNVFWQVRFNKAGNFFYESVATIGWLGIISFLVLFGFFGVTVGFLLYRLRLAAQANAKNEHANTKSLAEESNAPHANLSSFISSISSAVPRAEEVSTASAASHADNEDFTFPLIVLLSIFASVLASLWLSVPGTSIYIVIWVIFGIAGVIGILHAPQSLTKLEWGFTGSIKNALSMSFGLVLAFVLLLFSIIFIGRLYLAEFYYRQALVSLNQARETENLEQARIFIAKSINLNSKISDYYLSFAQISLAKLERLENAEPEQTQALLSAAVNESKKAVDLQKSSVSVWEKRGLIFESVTRWTLQARQHAINAFERAVQLEPTNPVLYYKLGENQRLMDNTKKMEDAGREEENAENTADQFDGMAEAVDLRAEAKKNLEKAIELKTDYIAPYFSLAKMAEDQEDLNSAISYLKTALKFSSNQNRADIYYELSRIEYNQILLTETKDSANLENILDQLSKAIELSPNYANALYTRALIYRQLNNVTGAIADMQKVADLNPNNQGAKEKLDELKHLENLPVQYGPLKPDLFEE